MRALPEILRRAGARLERAGGMARAGSDGRLRPTAFSPYDRTAILATKLRLGPAVIDASGLIGRCCSSGTGSGSAVASIAYRTSGRTLGAGGRGGCRTGGTRA